MAPKRQLIMLAVLVVVLALAVGYAWREYSASDTVGVAVPGRNPAGARAQTTLASVPTIRLDALAAARAAKAAEAPERDPFRFKPKPPPPPPPPVKPLYGPGSDSGLPPPPPPPPPIPFKFIGIVVQTQGQKLA